MKKIGLVVLFVLFNSVLILSLFRINYVLRNKDYSGAQDLFKHWNPEHADIVFIGNSHQFCSINPDILFDEYGIESFMLATSAQTVPESYYATLEAIEEKHPDKIVFEISYVANDFITVSPEMDHCFFDGMPLNKIKRQAINDLIAKDDRVYYWLPIGLYHVRWKDIKPEDFDKLSLSKRGNYTKTEVFANWEIPLVGRNEVLAMPVKMEEYYKRIIEACKENEIELIVYVAPFNGQYNDDDSKEGLLNREKIFNYAVNLAEEKGVKAVNLFYELDELNLDPNNDWGDSQHLNENGKAKLTRYMVEKGYFE